MTQVTKSRIEHNPPEQPPFTHSSPDFPCGPQEVFSPLKTFDIITTS